MGESFKEWKKLKLSEIKNWKTNAWSILLKIEFEEAAKELCRSTL